MAVRGRRDRFPEEIQQNTGKGIREEARNKSGQGDKIMWQLEPKRGRGRPPKYSSIAKMLWEGYPSVKAMREAKLRRVM
jgi:hypothetical protein